MVVWVLTRPPLGGRGDSDEQKDGIFYQFVHLRFFEWLLIIVMITAHEHLRESHKHCH